MKTLLSLLIVMCGSTVAFGQWSIGPKVSYGTITQSEAEIRIIPTSDEVPPQMTFLGGSSVKSIGFMLYNNLGPGFLQIEALGTNYNLDFSSKEQRRSSAEPTEYKEKYAILEIPVAAGINVKNFKVGVGPVLEISLSKDTELRKVDRYEDKSSKYNGGFQGLIGYTFGDVDVDLRYVYRFTGLVDEFGIGQDVLKLNRSANRLTISFGARMGRQKSAEDILLEEKEPIGDEALPLVH